jgi:hypothetical protein
MSELEDLKLQSEAPESTSRGSGGEGTRRRRRRSRPAVWLWILLILLILLLAAAAVWTFVSRGGEEAPPAPAPVAAPAEPEGPQPPDEEEPEPLELPPLAASDEVVRRLVEGLSARPQLAAWLATDELIRKLVASVDNVAEGASPRPHLKNAAPQGAFPVLERDGEVYLDPAGYDRYDTATAVFTSLDPRGTVRLYRQLKPLLDEAYRDLGYPHADFNDTLTRALFRLLETPVVQGDIRLVPKVTSYELADTRLEALSPAQKNLLRMGPDNQRLIQAQLRALARELGIPQQSLPRTPVWRAR